MARHALIEFFLKDSRSLAQLNDSKLFQRWWENRFHRQTLGWQSGGAIYEVTWGTFSPYCTCSLGFCIFIERTNTINQCNTSQTYLAGSLPPLLVSWQAISIIAVPTVNCKTQVIVCGVYRCAEVVLAKGTSAELRWTHATPLSLADSSRFCCCGQCICHNVSTPCSTPIQGWNHSSLFSSSGFGVIHYKVRDFHQLFQWEEAQENRAFWKANTSWFNWKTGILWTAEEISPKVELEG